jgi:hypothetical protein
MLKKTEIVMQDSILSFLDRFTEVFPELLGQAMRASSHSRVVKYCSGKYRICKQVYNQRTAPIFDLQKYSYMFSATIRSHPQGASVLKDIYGVVT